MALAITLQVDFKDAKNKSSFTRVRIPTSLSIAQAVEFAQGACQVIADVSTCRVVGASLNFALDLSSATLTNVQNVLADVSTKALFMFNSAISGLKARFNIPTFDEDNLVVVGSDQVDIVDPGVAAFITACEDGYAITSGNMSPTDKRGNDLILNTEARELFVKRKSA